MSHGKDLNPTEVQTAIKYNRERFRPDFIQIIQSKVSFPSNGNCDEAFVRAIANWQEANVRAGSGDGRVDHITESLLNIMLPQAQKAADEAKALSRAGNVLFDSWGNDGRDNNGDGVVDDAREKGEDGRHFSQVFQSFWVRKGSYPLGYPGRPPRTIIISADQHIRGHFIYRVCADMVSAAYHKAGVMSRVRSVERIVAQMEKVGRLWRRDNDKYPTRYLPGDLIAIIREDKKGEGHCGIVVEEGYTKGGDNGPVVFELPGPSWEASDGVYDPRRTNDAKIDTWSRHKWYRNSAQWLARMLYSKIHSHAQTK